MQMQPETFAATDLTDLRLSLKNAGLDSWQAGELIGAFLAERGYGVSRNEACKAAARIESVGCNMERMRHELNQLALAM